MLLNSAVTRHIMVLPYCAKVHCDFSCDFVKTCYFNIKSKTTLNVTGFVVVERSIYRLLCLKDHLRFILYWNNNHTQVQSNQNEKGTNPSTVITSEMSMVVDTWHLTDVKMSMVVDILTYCSALQTNINSMFVASESTKMLKR